MVKAKRKKSERGGRADQRQVWISKDLYGRIVERAERDRRQVKVEVELVLEAGLRMLGPVRSPLDFAGAPVVGSEHLSSEE